MKHFLTAMTLAASLMGSAAFAQDKKLEIVFTVHSGASNTFWQAVQKGYEDACSKVNANCQMVYLQLPFQKVQFKRSEQRANWFVLPATVPS